MFKEKLIEYYKFKLFIIQTLHYKKNYCVLFWIKTRSMFFLIKAKNVLVGKNIKKIWT